MKFYSCHLLCRKRGGGGSGKSYHWVTAKLSTSTDVALLVHVIPAWQHKPRRQPSQDWLLFQITWPAISHAKRIFKVRLYILQHLPINGAMGKWQRKEQSINIRSLMLAHSTDGTERPLTDAGVITGCCRAQMKKKKIERFPSLSPPLRRNMLTATYLTCAKWMNGD